jgi:hypothetical protein
MASLTSRLINTSRGPIVHEPAIIEVSFTTAVPQRRRTHLWPKFARQVDLRMRRWRTSRCREGSPRSHSRFALACG